MSKKKNSIYLGYKWSALGSAIATVVSFLLNVLIKDSNISSWLWAVTFVGILGSPTFLIMHFVSKRDYSRQQAYLSKVKEDAENDAKKAREKLYPKHPRVLTFSTSPNAIDKGLLEKIGYLKQSESKTSIEYECAICGNSLEPQADQVLICTENKGVEAVCLLCLKDLEDYAYDNGGFASFGEKLDKLSLPFVGNNVESVDSRNLDACKKIETVVIPKEMTDSNTTKENN